MEDANSKRLQTELKPTTLDDFIQNPLNKNINPRNLVSFIIDKKRAKSLTRKIDEGLQVERKTPLVKSEIDTIRTPEQILSEMTRQDYINKKDKKLLKEMLYTNPISDDLRRKLWFTVSGAKVKRGLEPDYYRKVSKECTNYPTYFEPIIELDLKRTFPDKPYDPKDQTIEKMRSVLNTYAKRNPFIGYCQGMNFIIARIIEVVQDEEESFWILVALLEDLLPIDYFSSMVGVLVDQKVFGEMLFHHDKELGRKFAELEVDLSLFSLQWFVCCYVSTFSKKLCNVVWDMLLIEGGSILFKTGLVFLSYLKPQILAVKEFNEVFGLIEENSNVTEDVKDFLKRLQQIYISKRLLRIVRKQYQWITEEELQQVESKKRARPQPFKNEDPPIVVCNLDWPVCLDVLDKSKQKKRNPSVICFRADRRKEPKGNYLTTEFKHTHYHKNQLKKMIMNKERGRDFHVKVENTPASNNFLFEPKLEKIPSSNTTNPTTPSVSSVTSESGRKQQEFSVETTIRVSENPLIVQAHMVIGRHHHTCDDVNKYKKMSIRKHQTSPQRARKTSRMEEYVKNSLAELRDENSPAQIRLPNPKNISRTENKIPPITHKSFTVHNIPKTPVKQEESGVGSLIRGLFGSKNIKSKEETDKRFEKNISPKKEHSPELRHLEGGEMPRKAKISIYNYIMEQEDMPNYEGKGIDSEKKSIMFMREFFKE